MSDSTVKTNDTAVQATSAATLRRILPVVDNNSPLGIWYMESPSCPMHKHQDAIDAPHEQCAKGVQTNMQGAIPLGQCKHAKKLDYDNLHVECEFVERLA